MNALQGLSVWNKACELAVRSCAAVGDCGDRIFRDQITRASLSVASSIAEGYERDSKQQFADFLKVAKDACAELRTQLYIAAQLDLITVQKSTELMQDSMEITRLLQGLIEWCNVEADPAAAQVSNSGETHMNA
jgi:four helix bundle protein